MSANQTIIRILRCEYELAASRHCTTYAALAATKAGHAAWEEFNPDDGVGGFGGNPHSITRAAESNAQAEDHLRETKQAYDHAVDTFVIDTPRPLED